MLKISVACGSFLGLIWQTILMTGLFLQYDVVNEVEISAPQSMSMDVSISICPLYASFLKKTELSALLTAKGLPSIDVEDSENLANNIEGLLTLEEIFKLTPKSSELLQFCRYRQKESYLIFNATTDCDKQVFHVVKFFYLHSVCYRFTQYPADFDEEDFKEEYNVQEHVGEAFLGQGIDLSYEKMETTSEYPGIIAEIQLDPKFIKNITNLMISISDTFPRGLDHFPVILAKTNSRNNLLSAKKRYSFTFSWIRNHLLPPPYKTNCRNYRMTTKFESDRECLDQCILSKGVKELGRIMSSAIAFDPSTLGHLLTNFYRDLNLSLIPITTVDVNNETIRQHIRRIEEACTKKCFQPDCVEKKFMTKVTVIEQSAHHSHRMFLPDAAVMYTVYSPKLTFVQYLIYLFNCINFWIGLSVFKALSFFNSFKRR